MKAWPPSDAMFALVLVLLPCESWSHSDPGGGPPLQGYSIDLQVSADSDSCSHFHETSRADVEAGVTVDHQEADCSPEAFGRATGERLESPRGPGPWRVHLLSSATGRGNGASAEAYLFDHYTVTGTDPEGIEVTLRIPWSGRIEGSPHPQTWFALNVRVNRVRPDGCLEQFNFLPPVGPPRRGYVDARLPGTYGDTLLITLPRVPSGTILQIDQFFTIANAIGSSTDPFTREVELDATFSVCAAAGRVVARSGAVGDCGSGDVAALDVQAVQAVFDVSTMVVGKPMVVSLDLSSTFSEPVSAEVVIQIDAANGTQTIRTDTILVPPNCARKRYYFPSPDPLQQDGCGFSAEALDSFQAADAPDSDFTLSALVRADSDTEPANDDAPPREYRSKRTALEVAYTSVSCLAASCATDPDGYGEVLDPDLDLAAAINDEYLLAMFPISASGYTTSRCNGTGSPCVTTAGSDTKCTAQDCLGIYQDISRSYLFAKVQGTNGPVVAFCPGGYFIYHRMSGSITLQGLTVPGAPELAVVALVDGVLGRDPDYFGTRTISATHELAHYFGLRGHDTPAARAAGYWPGCDRRNGKCEAVSADNLRADTVSSFEPPDVWIDREDYEFLLAELKTDPDPPRLILTGLLTREGVFTLGMVSEGIPAKAKPPSVIDTDEYFIVGRAADGTMIYRDGFSVSFESPSDHWPGPVNVIPVLATIPYPAELERVQLLRGESVLGEFNPVSASLRTLIERVADEGFVKEPEQRRRTLLSKVDEFEKMLTDGKYVSAKNKLENDIRKHVMDWLVDYRLTGSDQASVAEVRKQVDFVSARLATLAKKGDNRKPKK